MKKILVLFLIFAVLLGTGLVGFADSQNVHAMVPVAEFDTSHYEGTIESAYVILLHADGEEVPYELNHHRETGRYKITPKIYRPGITIEYFLINGVKCYPGRQVLVSQRDNGMTTYMLDTLEEVFLIELDDGGRCEVTGELRYIAGEDVSITGSFTADDERIYCVGLYMKNYGLHVYPNYPVNDCFDCHLELSNDGTTWNWLVQIDGIDSDGVIRVRY